MLESAFSDAGQKSIIQQLCNARSAIAQGLSNGFSGRHCRNRQAAPDFLYHAVLYHKFGKIRHGWTQQMGQYQA
jgi:hypothetical protein